MQIQLIALLPHEIALIKKLVSPHTPESIQNRNERAQVRTLLWDLFSVNEGGPEDAARAAVGAALSRLDKSPRARAKARVELVRAATRRAAMEGNE